MNWRLVRRGQQVAMTAALAAIGCARGASDAPSPASAQDSLVRVALDTTIGTGIVEGLVVSEKDSRPVQGVIVLVLPRGVSGAVVSKSGGFTLYLDAEAKDTLVLTSLCYQRMAVPLALPRSGGLRVTIAMREQPPRTNPCPPWYAPLPTIP